MSFRKQPWELYNIRQDRSELNDLADAESERLAAMVRTWTEMAERVLQADEKVYSPVRQERTGYSHPDWTNFDGKLGPIGRRGK